MVKMVFKKFECELAVFFIRYISIVDSGADLGNFLGWGVISQMLWKYDQRAREAREIFFYPTPGEGGETISE